MTTLATSIHRDGSVGLGSDISRQELILVALRTVLVALALMVTAASGNFPRLGISAMAVVAIAVAASLPAVLRRSTAVAAVLEALALVVVATIPQPAAGTLLFYWLAPALAAGARGGYRWVGPATLLPAAIGVVLVLRGSDPFVDESLVFVLQWGALASMAGLLAAWARREDQLARADPQRSYADAVRVLTELEGISKRLPTGLDLGTLSAQVLREVASAVPAQRSAVVARDPAGGHLVLAALPDGRTDWLPDEATTQAWFSAESDQGSTDRTTGNDLLAVVPLVVAGRRIGVVVLLNPRDQAPADVRRAQLIANRGALPLEAARIFDEVRSAAANEERGRVAREIHDGIAQDVAVLGYAVDEIISRTTEDEVRTQAEELRSEITRVVKELRMSVFHLRTDVPRSMTLGGVLSDYANRVLGDSSTELHLSLDESSQRLPHAVESELLRIGQEAITNVRRHAEASNVWLSVRVSGPNAAVTVSDDGKGLGPARADSFGLEIMAERAQAIHADFAVEARPGGGTVVSVTV